VPKTNKGKLNVVKNGSFHALWTAFGDSTKVQIVSPALAIQGQNRRTPVAAYTMRVEALALGSLGESPTNSITAGRSKT
jgi:hypothetical protein